jgi:hypothetical protein
MLMFIFAALLIAGAVGWFTNRRTPAPVPARPGNHPGPVYGTPGAGYDDEGAYGVNRQVSAGLADAEAEARHWVTRLGSGITALEGMNGGENVAARQSVAEAAERHASARRQLAEAYTLKQVQLSGRTAIEGLHYLRSARLALGLDAGPDVPQEMPVPVVQETRRVTVNDQEYVASSGPGEATPYYYPGGQVRGRMVPSGWYSAPWWKTAMVAGAAGIGSMLVLDALFDGMHGMHGHHGGGFPGGGGPGGFDGDGFFGGDGFGF